MPFNESPTQPKEHEMLSDNSTTELYLVEGDAPEIEDFHLGKEIGKSLALSTAQTAGVFGGFVLVAIAYEGGTRLYKRFFKKNEPVLTVVPDMPEAEEA
jgi:hypothetical protein